MIISSFFLYIPKDVIFNLIDIFRWQARKEQDRNMRAGLIPSRALQERRIVHERNEKMNTLVDGEGR